MTFSLKTIGLATAITALTAGSAFAAVSTTSLNVRSGPGINYGVVATLSPGEYVSIRAQSNGWCEIGGPGPNGWASCAYLTGNPQVATGPDYSYDYGLDYFDYGPSITIGPTFPVFPYHHDHHTNNNWWWWNMQHHKP